MIVPVLDKNNCNISLPSTFYEVDTKYLQKISSMLSFVLQSTVCLCFYIHTQVETDSDFLKFYSKRILSDAPAKRRKREIDMIDMKEQT